MSAALVAFARRVAALLGRFGAAREAVAAVEFALILPIMLTLYLGSIELSQLINMDQRVTNIAGTVGDLAARANGTLKNSDLQNYFSAATAIIAPFTTTGLQQVVSEVQVNTDGTTKVLWSVGYNGGSAKNINLPFPGPHAIPPSMIAITQNNSNNDVIVSEATYSYQPLLGLFFQHAFTLYHQGFYLPRYASAITYDASN